MRLFAIIGIILLLSSPAFGATYYVSATGDASDPGCSGSTPCDETCIDDCWDMSDVNGAAATLEPGDTIYFCDGNGDFTTMLTVPESGTEGNLYTFVAYPGETPVIDAQGSNAIGIYINAKDYITIDGFTIKNLSDGNGSAGVMIDSSDWITVQNCTITVTTGARDDTKRGNSIKILTTSANAENLTITNNNLSRGKLGIHLNSCGSYHPYNVTISNNVIHDNYDADGTELGGADGIGHISLGAGCSGIVQDNGLDDLEATIEHNEIYNFPDQAIDVITTKNVDIRYNYIHDSWNDVEGGNNGGIKMALDQIAYDHSENINVYYNIITDCVHDGIYTGDVVNGTIYNNTIVNCGTTWENYAIHTQMNSGGEGDDSNGLTIKNNIMYGGRRGIYILTTGLYIIDLDNNVYYKPNDPLDDNTWAWGRYNSVTYTTPTYTFANWQSAVSSFDDSSDGADPLFVNASGGNFRLLSTSSPAYDAGTNVGLSTDYYGTVVPQGSGYDIGAIEYVPGSILGLTSGSSLTIQ